MQNDAGIPGCRAAAAGLRQHRCRRCRRGDAARRGAAQGRHPAAGAGATRRSHPPNLAIRLAGRIRGLSNRQAEQAARSLAEELDIGEWLDRRALPDGAGISGGIRRLTAFAMAVVAPTPLIVLDEPTNDIDAPRRRLLWDAVRRRGDEGAGVLLVTHNVSEAERIVDELVVLHHGAVVAAGSPTSLRGTADQDLRLEIQQPPSSADPEPLIPPVPILREVPVGRRRLFTIHAADAAAAVAWAAALRADGRIEGYTLGPATLEDAYLALTGAQPSVGEQRSESEEDTHV